MNNSDNADTEQSSAQKAFIQYQFPLSQRSFLADQIRFVTNQDRLPSYACIASANNLQKENLIPVSRNSAIQRCLFSGCKKNPNIAIQTNDDRLATLASIPLRFPPPRSPVVTRPKLEKLRSKIEEINSTLIPSRSAQPSTKFNEIAEDVIKDAAPPCDYTHGCGSIGAGLLKSLKPYSKIPCNSFSPMEHWGREAQVLLNEMTTVANSRSGRKSSWPNSEHPETPDDGNSPVKPSPVNLHSPISIQDHVDEMKPSPYPGGSPTFPIVRSNHTSDNDADDDATSLSTSPGSVIEVSEKIPSVIARPMPRLRTSDSFRSAPDSGYSSSTDTDSVRFGSLATLSEVETDDLSSQCSSRPVSPIRFSSAAELGSVSPTSVDPYVSSLLEAPWINATFPFTAPPAHIIQKTFPKRTVSAPPPGFKSVEGREGEVYHKHKKWITDEILEMIAVRDRLYKRMKKHPAPDIVDMYKKVRNMVVGMTRNAKRAYEKKMDESRNGRGRSSYIGPARNGVQSRNR